MSGSDSPTSDYAMPEDSSAVSDGHGSVNSIEFSTEIPTTENHPHTKLHRKHTHKKHKKAKQSMSHKIFDANTCTTKILGIHRRKDISGPPIVPSHLYHDRSRYHRNLRRYHEIARENARLIQRISNIYIKDSVVDNRLVEFTRVNRPGWHRYQRVSQIASENFYLYSRLQKVRPVLSRQDQLAWYAEQEEYMGRISRYPLFFHHLPCFKDPLYKSVIPETAYAALQIQHGKKEMETDNLVLELFTHDSPATTVNFLIACEDNHNDFSYTGKSVDKLVSICTAPSKYKRAYWKVGSSTYVEQKSEHCIQLEKNKLKHTEAGLITRPLKIATGEFYITIGPSPFLDGKCCIFGRLIGDSLAFLQKMEEENVDMYGNLLTPMVIKGCKSATNILDIFLMAANRFSVDSQSQQEPSQTVEAEKPIVIVKEESVHEDEEESSSEDE